MTAKPWLNSARLATWRLEFSDLAWPDSGLSEKWERRATYFREKGVNAVVLSGFHFRWDYHSVFDRIFGALNEITSICHQQELHVIERHSATRVHRVRDEADRRLIQNRFSHRVPFYPDDWANDGYGGESLANWRQISARDGEPIFVPGEVSASFCPNHPGFQKGYLDYIRRLVTAVPIDAILPEDFRFLPDTYSCACSHCRQKFQNETGLKLPRADDRSFWENRDNPAFLNWLQSRYRWQAEPYASLRAALPKEILLLAALPGCLEPRFAETGLSAPRIAEHVDALCYEIPSGLKLGGDEPEILSELAAFGSLLGPQSKTLVTLFRPAHPDQVSAWFHFLAPHHVRPWIASELRKQQPTSEEDLLSHGYSFDKVKKSAPSKLVQAIAFSESFRDSLPPAKAEIYVDAYRTLSADLLSRGNSLYLLFDTRWTSASPEHWECLWVLDPKSLGDAEKQKLEEWNEKGLAIGVA